MHQRGVSTPEEVAAIWRCEWDAHLADVRAAMKDRPAQLDDFFTKFRKSPQFEASKKQYAPGWGANDRVADPMFVSLEANDFRLQRGGQIGSNLAANYK